MSTTTTAPATIFQAADAVWAAAVALGDLSVFHQCAHVLHLGPEVHAWPTVHYSSGTVAEVRRAALRAGVPAYRLEFFGQCAATMGHVHPSLVDLLEELDLLVTDDEAEEEAEYHRQIAAIGEEPPHPGPRPSRSLMGRGWSAYQAAIRDWEKAEAAHRAWAARLRAYKAKA